MLLVDVWFFVLFAVGGGGWLSCVLGGLFVAAGGVVFVGVLFGWDCFVFSTESLILAQDERWRRA